jgi:hypothetical protein
MRKKFFITLALVILANVASIWAEQKQTIYVTKITRKRTSSERPLFVHQAEAENDKKTVKYLLSCEDTTKDGDDYFCDPLEAGRTYPVTRWDSTFCMNIKDTTSKEDHEAMHMYRTCWWDIVKEEAK